MTGLQNGHDPARGEYDYRRFAAALRRKRQLDARGLRALADEIGVTYSDLSRAMGGQNISVGKVIALCRWLDVPVYHFYIEPDFSLKPACCTGRNVKHSTSVGVHG
jgi:transcriptional regulator with XRE-family HTH domain